MKFTNWPLSDLLPLILWPVGVFTILLIICFFIFRPLRKKGIQSAKILTVVLPIIGWAIWHFYPVFTFQGTYIAKFQYLDSEDTSTIVITDKYQWGEGNPVDYEVDPVFRLLWVEMGIEKPMAVKLGWNSVHAYVFKVGLIKHEKEK